MTYFNASGCPACGLDKMREVRAHNSLSRYCDAYICSDCGVEEALAVFWYWRLRAERRGIKGQEIKGNP